MNTLYNNQIIGNGGLNTWTECNIQESQIMPVNKKKQEIGYDIYLVSTRNDRHSEAGMSLTP
jgi:hypothetical protein